MIWLKNQQHLRLLAGQRPCLIIESAEKCLILMAAFFLSLYLFIFRLFTGHCPEQSQSEWRSWSGSGCGHHSPTAKGFPQHPMHKAPQTAPQSRQWNGSFRGIRRIGRIRRRRRRRRSQLQWTSTGGHAAAGEGKRARSGQGQGSRKGEGARQGAGTGAGTPPSHAPAPAQPRPAQKVRVRPVHRLGYSLHPPETGRWPKVWLRRHRRFPHRPPRRRSFRLCGM